MSHRKYIFGGAILTLILNFHPASSLFAEETKPKKVSNLETDNTINDSSEQTEFEQLLEKELEKNDTSKEESPRESTNWAFQIFKTIIGLGIIIGILYLFRKYMIFKNSFGNLQTGIITLLHEYPINSGKKLQIIEVGNRLLLIGVSDAGIQLITEFKEKLSIDQIKLSLETLGKNETKDFWIELSKSIGDYIKSRFSRKSSSKKFNDYDSKAWEAMQNNARVRIQEMRDKKKLFDELDNSHDTKIE